MKKLHELAFNSLLEKELSSTKGGYKLPQACCSPCGCKYAGDQDGPDDSFYGGSSTSENRSANNNAAQSK